MSHKLLAAAAMTAAGFCLLVAGAAIVWIPAGFIAAGLGLLLAGLFLIDTGGSE